MKKLIIIFMTLITLYCVGCQQQTIQEQTVETIETKLYEEEKPQGRMKRKQVPFPKKMRATSKCAHQKNICQNNRPRRNY